MEFHKTLFHREWDTRITQPYYDEEEDIVYAWKEWSFITLSIWRPPFWANNRFKVFTRVRYDGVPYCIFTLGWIVLYVGRHGFWDVAAKPGRI